MLLSAFLIFWPWLPQSSQVPLNREISRSWRHVCCVKGKQQLKQNKTRENIMNQFLRFRSLERKQVTQQLLSNTSRIRQKLFIMIKTENGNTLSQTCQYRVFCKSLLDLMTTFNPILVIKWKKLFGYYFSLLDQVCCVVSQ